MVLTDYDEKNIGSFVGKTIDISDASLSISTHLDIQWAKKNYNVTQKQLSIQLAEKHIFEIAKKANITVICLEKDVFENVPELFKESRATVIILLK